MKSSLSKTKISNHFSKLGYKVIQIKKPWRHFCGQLEKGEQKYFFKLAGDLDLNANTESEVVWNIFILNEIKNTNTDYFTVPDIISDGYIDQNYYFISEHFSGNLLATKYPPKTQNLEKWLDKIVDCNHFLISLENNNLINKRKINSFNPKEWMEDLAKFNLGNVFELALKLENIEKNTICHGDFVPWHMIENGDKFVLIDGEKGKNNGFIFYDVAYFYHRLYTAGQNLSLAKKYLNKFYKKLDKAKKNKFDDIFLSVLASRIIGGFWDYNNKDKTKLEFHKQIKNDLLNNDIK